MEHDDTLQIDSDIVNNSFSTRAPKVKLSPLRLLFRDSTLFLIFKGFLIFAAAGALVFALWSKIFGGILASISLLIGFSIWRYIKLRQIEFQNAVLCPGILIDENPPTVLILANLVSNGQSQPTWAVKIEDCRSVKPFRCVVGTRIPCVTAFQGSGYGGTWEQMVSAPLTSGTGDKDTLTQALARLNDEAEWQVLLSAIHQKKIPEYGKTLRL